jgi:hypothetical protein
MTDPKHDLKYGHRHFRCRSCKSSKFSLIIDTAVILMEEDHHDMVMEFKVSKPKISVFHQTGIKIK